jgi:hypothetical protein
MTSKVPAGTGIVLFSPKRLLVVSVVSSALYFGTKLTYEDISATAQH